jgi:hypothetical protein
VVDATLPTRRYRMSFPTNEIWLQIHEAIHSDAESVTVEEVDLPIVISSNGCRRVNWKGLMFMEQNKAKKSTWAALAKRGSKITWVIRPVGGWGLIQNGKIERE